jgi:hypothetical protein
MLMYVVILTRPQTKNVALIGNVPVSRFALCRKKITRVVASFVHDMHDEILDGHHFARLL